MLTIKDLTKNFGKTKILDHLNLEVHQGDIYGFLGQNGSGKTTTLNCITNILKFDEGQVIIPKDKVIAYLSESPKFYDYMTALEYLLYLYEINHEKKDLMFLENLLKEVGLIDHKNKKIKYFSRGMKQRLGIASTLINDPDLILLDEPTSALDPKGRQDVMDIILRLNTKGKTIMFSTHILNDVERLCNRVGILHQQKLIQEGALEDILVPGSHYMILAKDVKIAEAYLRNHQDFEMVSQTNNTLVFSYYGASNQVLKNLIDMNTEILEFKKHTLTLEELYLKAVTS